MSKIYRKIIVIFCVFFICISLTSLIEVTPLDTKCFRKSRKENHLLRLREEIVKKVDTVKEGNLSKQNIKEFVRFKFGDMELTSHMADKVVNLIKENYRNLNRQDYVILIRKTAMPRQSQRLVEMVAEKLGIETVEVTEGSSIVNYSRSSAEERLNAYKGTMLIKKNLQNKKVIILDDIVVSGSSLAEETRAAIEAGASKEDVLPVTYWDGRHDVYSETKLMDYYAKNPGLIKLEGLNYTQSFMKFLMRLTHDGEGVLSGVLSHLGEEDIYEILYKMSWGFKKDIFPSTALGEFKQVFQTAVGTFWPKLNEGRKKGEILKEIKRNFPRRNFDSRGTLTANSYNWSTEAVLGVWGYMMNYDYLVLENRRQLSDSEVEELMETAKVLKLNITSPYFTNKEPSEIYPFLHNEKVLDSLPELREYRNKLNRIKSFNRERISHNFYPWDEFIELSEDYTGKVFQIAYKVADIVWEDLKQRDKIPHLKKDDIAVLVGGSVGREEGHPFSDLDLDIIIKSREYEGEIFEFSERFIKSLRAIGIKGTPAELFMSHLKKGYYLLNLKDPVPERLSDNQELSSIIRLFSDRYVWGNENLFKKLLQNESLQSKASNLLPDLKEEIRNYMRISEEGYGRVSRRDFRIWEDEALNRVYNIQLGLRFFQLGVYKLLLDEYGLEKVSSLNHIGEVLDSISKENPMGNPTVQNVKESYYKLILLRHKKAYLENNLFSPVDKDTLLNVTGKELDIKKELNFLLNFIEENLS